MVYNNAGLVMALQNARSPSPRRTTLSLQSKRQQAPYRRSGWIRLDRIECFDISWPGEATVASRRL